MFYQTYQIKSGKSGSSVALPIAKLLTWMQFVSDYSFTVNILAKRIFTIVVAILFRSTFLCHFVSFVYKSFWTYA